MKSVLQVGDTLFMHPVTYRELKRQLEARELDEARRIQRKLLPATLPQMDGCELAASWQPATGGAICWPVGPDSDASWHPAAR